MVKSEKRIVGRGEWKVESRKWKVESGSNHDLLSTNYYRLTTNSVDFFNSL